MTTHWVMSQCRALIADVSWEKSTLSGLELLTPWIATAVLFYALRWLEVWLHQHIFKVGWLVTKQYHTTTVIYYAFFLPGILINQVVFWLTAGFMNVRAQSVVAWPQKQEIGELKLDFVRLSSKVDSVRLALISTTPLLVGLVLIWHIANNVLNVPAFLNEINQTSSSGLLLTIGKFTSTADFWIWVYFAFTISNTMMPNLDNLRGWRIVLIALAIGVGALFAVGAGNQVILANLRGPITDTLNGLSSIFAIIIGLDIFAVAVLGTIEAIIERITGDSATFKDGKMITMRRSEMLAQRARALAPQPKRAQTATAPSGPPSVYRLPFPIPGPPGKEAVTPAASVIIEPGPTASLTSGGLSSPGRAGPPVISGTVAEKLPPPSPPPSGAPTTRLQQPQPAARPAGVSSPATPQATKPGDSNVREEEDQSDDEVRDEDRI